LGQSVFLDFFVQILLSALSQFLHILEQNCNDRELRVLSKVLVYRKKDETVVGEDFDLFDYSI
jgi:hypothetical protein